MAQQAAPADAETEAESASPDNITVTASRISRAGFTAPTPTTVIGQEAMQQRGASNIADVLNEVPAFRPTQTPTQRTVFAGAGQNTADLRGLGPQRTLVLIDGRRYVPSSATGVVDLNLIPTIMLERSEVVTGGASAAWGSDAVAGVVNFITAKKLDGVKTDISYGVSQRGDGNEFRAALAFGGNIAGDRGHFVVGGEYVSRSGIDNAYLSRAWGAKAVNILTVPTTPARAADQPSRFYAAPVQLVNEPAGGLIIGVNADTNPANGADVLRGIRFGAGGAIQSYNYGQVYGTFSLGGGEFNQGAYGLMSVPVKRYSVLLNADYTLTDHIQAFIQGGIARSISVYPTVARRISATPSAAALPTAVDYILIKRDNAFLPAQVAQIMDANKITQFYMGRGGVDLGRPIASPTNETQRIAMGLQGDFGSSWKWNAYYEYGRNKYTQIYEHMSSESKFQKAYDAVYNSAGQIVCRVNQTRVTDAACVPMNLFGIGVASQASINYTTGTQFFETNYSQQVFSANLNGEPFSTWAGPVSVAVGAEYRKERIKAVSDETSIEQDWDYGNYQPYAGHFDTKEIYAETVVPLLKDIEFAKSLELNAAIRRTDYSTSGGVTTWKIGATYEPNDWIRFRTTRSRDIRAPNLQELFGVAKATTSAINPFTNVSTGPIQGTTGGNPALRPEKADTLTAGIILSPHFIPRLRFSADFYSIKIKNAIATYTSQNIVDNCAIEIRAGAPGMFCGYVNATGSGSTYTISSITTVPFNLTSQTAKGIDFEAAYSFPAFGGNIDLRGLLTYTIDRTNVDLVRTTQNAGYLTGAPKVVSNLSTTYTRDRLSTTLQARFFGAVRLDPTLIGPDQAGYSPTLSNSVNINRNPAMVYFNLSAQYKLLDTSHGGLELYVVVNNLLDKDPPYTGPSFFYDPIGRYFKVGARMSF